MPKPFVLLEARQVWAAPEGPWVLTGLASGHPRLPGRRRPFHTSRIVRFAPAEGAAESLNTCFRLGPPLRRLAFGQDGRPVLIEIAGLVAERAPGTDRWRITRAGRALDRFVETDIYRVLDRLLDHEPPPSDEPRPRAPRAPRPAPPVHGARGDGRGLRRSTARRSGTRTIHPARRRALAAPLRPGDRP